MATRIWTGGAGNGDWNDTGNWQGGVVPTNGDDVYFDERGAANNAVTNLTGHTGNTINLYVSKGFQGNIGQQGEAGLDYQVTTARIAGSGTLYKLGHTTATLRVQVGRGTTVYATAGTYTTVEVSSGNFTATGATVTTLRNIGGQKIELQSGGSAGTTLTTASGVVETARSWATVNIKGGATVRTSSAAAVTTKANIEKGGTLQHNSSGTVTNMEVFPGGLFTPKGAPRNFTVTDYTQWEGGDVIEREPGITITFTNPKTPIGDPPM